MPAPIEAQGPGFGKVVGYRMPDSLVQTFFTAIKKTEGSGPIDPNQINEANDSVHELTDALGQPFQKKRAAEK
jgi:hypothetical protein